MRNQGKMTVRKRRDCFWGYFFIAPVFLGLLVFFILPFIQTFWFSFNDVNKFNLSSFTGLDNYRKLLGDKELWKSAGNTFLYVIGVVPAGVVLSVVIAALLNTKIRFTSIYRTLYFLPAVTMPAAIAMAWKWIFNGQYGVLNQFLGIFGSAGRNWLADPGTALFMIIIVGVWSTVGYNMIILLAGLQGISKSYYEAASIDGAGPIRQFLSISLPLLTPTIFFVVITSVINGFRVFDTVFMMISTESMAFESTETLVVLFYRYAFDYGDKGYAASIAVFIFFIILIFTTIQMKFQNRWVYYD